MVKLKMGWNTKNKSTQCPQSQKYNQIPHVPASKARGGDEAKAARRV